MSFCLKSRNKNRFAWWQRDIDSSCRAGPVTNKAGTGSEISEQSESCEVHGMFCPHTERTKAGRVICKWVMWYALSTTYYGKVGNAALYSGNLGFGLIN